MSHWYSLMSRRKLSKGKNPSAVILLSCANSFTNPWSAACWLHCPWDCQVGILEWVLVPSPWDLSDREIAGKLILTGNQLHSFAHFIFAIRHFSHLKLFCRTCRELTCSLSHLHLNSTFSMFLSWSHLHFNFANPTLQIFSIPSSCYILFPLTHYTLH